MAFEPAAGRLWVICRRCNVWNLSPIEERWETVDECESAYSLALRKFTSGRIGVAEVASGFHLVRVGEPHAEEFAAWRYGRRLRARRYRAGLQSALATTTVSVAAALGIGVLYGVSSLALGGYLALLVREQLRPGQPHASTADDNLPGIADSKFLRVRADGTELGWSLDDQRGTVISGPTLRHTLARVLPNMNRWAGSRDEQEAALRLIRDAKGPEGYLKSLRSRRAEIISSFRRVERLALEMATNEENERRAFQGELSLLLADWEDAAEHAAIADSLLVPLPIEERLWQLRLSRSVETRGL